jgi:putative ABC transport system permease protein
VGLVASVVGYMLGVGLAALLSSVIIEDGASLTILPTSVIVGLLIGTLVTLGSAFFPAWRASRVAPVAAMRSVDIDTSHRSLVRLGLGLAVLVLGVASLVSGLGSGTIQVAGFGVFLVFTALVILGPTAARPAAITLGRPLPVVRGVVGRLAQQNAARNPKRTASTGSALMIGLGIVSLFLVFNASLRQSIDDSVDDRFSGDFVIDSGTGFMGGGLPSEVASEINDLPEVGAATGVRFGFAEVEGSSTTIGGLDPETGFDLFDVGIVDGDPSGLDADGIGVFKDKAEDEGWRVGDEINVRFAETGDQTFTIVALLDTRDLTGTYVMGPEAFDANIPTAGDAQIWIRLADGVSIDEGREAITPVLDEFPTAELQDLSEFKASTKAQFDPFLILVNVLLALTILIAMIGIVNTLILSVVERTREIGLTRAVGASRGQIRSTIRWEALLIAAFGLMAALGIGIFFGWVFVNALKDEGFSSFVIPFRDLLIVTIVTAVLTLLAALFPAAWAGRRPILSAISQG